MSKIGIVSFDFTQNRIKLGRQWINCVSPVEKKTARLKSKTILPSRSESIITLQCDPLAAFVQADFEPRKLHGINGVYVVRWRVSPNALGAINVSVLNVNEKDIEIAGRYSIGEITCPNEILSIERCSISENVANFKDSVIIEESLSELRKIHLKRRFGTMLIFSPKMIESQKSCESQNIG